MIRRVRLGSFKRFRDQSFELHDSIVLAGPNNSGKSTLLRPSRPGNSVSITGSRSARVEAGVSNGRGWR
ncbi:MAG: hypothetical protein OXU64_06045 [Gemmatimonadota bacterium]|nr:hypothetical protein [Gemmatimonadota bacterium]